MADYYECAIEPARPRKPKDKAKAEQGVQAIQRWILALFRTGKTGASKSYLAQAIANRSIVDGFRAFYIRVPALLEQIAIARADGSYTNFLRKLAKFHLLILDDFGINPLSADDATNLLEIIEDRVNLSSVITTSQLPASKWYEYLNNDTVADAILDRIVHSSHRVEIKGDSMRKIMSKI